MLDSTMCIDAAVRLLAAKNIKAALHFLMECITAIENAREYKGTHIHTPKCAHTHIHTRIHAS